ncbi:MAG: ribulose-phosphate 3-epimerase [Cytophagales bacterium]|nr:ribulose-phosphate 3-epimerase [Cytophagales bacterium]
MSNRMVSPSILAADFANLQSEVELLNESSADYIHIDIMDGVFVPNISFGFPVCKAIHQHATKPLDFHLMIQNSDAYLEDCKKSGAEIISVHFEACPHLHRTIGATKELGCKAGVVLNPHTSIEVLNEILPDLDLVLIMSVNPGFGGQKFIPSAIQKVSKLRALASKVNPNLIIEVDGGVNVNSALDLYAAGADMLVAGSFVFKSDNPKDTIQSLKDV